MVRQRFMTIELKIERRSESKYKRKSYRRKLSS